MMLQDKALYDDDVIDEFIKKHELEDIDDIMYDDTVDEDKFETILNDLMGSFYNLHDFDIIDFKVLSSGRTDIF